jgi:Putative Flp pilus-assembly TadE/G-like
MQDSTASLDRFFSPMVSAEGRSEGMSEGTQRHKGSAWRLALSAPARICAQIGTRKNWNGESGQVLPLTAVSFGILMGFLALALDMAQVLYTKRELQTAADATALAGAIELSYCGGTAACSAMQTAVKQSAKENGIASPSLVLQCASSSSTGTTVQLNNGPCVLGASDPNAGNANYVETVISKAQPTFFAGVLGFPTLTVSARAEASLASSPYCAYILNPNASNALLLNGNATLTATCGIIVDSTASQAAVFNGNVSVTTKALDVAGGVLNNGNNSLNPAPTPNSTPMSDPLSSLQLPSAGACTYNNYVVNGNSDVTLQPGTYCGGLILNGGHYTATFSQGTYIMTGNLIVNGGASLVGTGVTFYFSSGSLTMNGNSHVDLVAPTSGTYAGMLYLQSRTDSSTVILNGDTSSGWQGTFYAPDAQLTLNGGNKSAAYTLLVVNTLTENGNDNFAIGSDYSSLPHGKSPLKGPKANLME